VTLFSVHLTTEANCDAEKVIGFLELIYKVYHDNDSMILHIDNTPIFIMTKINRRKGKIGSGDNLI
jgi:hypothetical protein